MCEPSDVQRSRLIWHTVLQIQDNKSEHISYIITHVAFISGRICVLHIFHHTVCLIGGVGWGGGLNLDSDDQISVSASFFKCLWFLCSYIKQINLKIILLKVNFLPLII